MSRDDAERHNRMEPVPEQDRRFGDPASPPTPWADALRVLETAELFWISTVRADGRPHVTPLPAVWFDDRLHFCTGPAEQKAVNLAHNAHVALTTGTNRWKQGLDLVVEGDAVQITDDARLRVLADLWRTKYYGDWDFAVEEGMFRHDDGGSAAVFGVAPTKVLAFAKGPFAQTRYRFPRQAADA
jgi:nitroimidazol reductase NimA-like FMN-containing flavoprotein (pyridoxamine 5'-phosphate oxidase superfamily)